VNRTAGGTLHATWLIGLSALFSLRVLGQLIQVLSPVSFLPALESWQGSSIPYWALLGIQLAIIALVVILARRIHYGRLIPNRRIGCILLILGAVYFTVMLARLVLGLTVLSGHPWFAKPIPAFFHLVLAGMVLTIGHYHWRRRT